MNRRHISCQVCQSQLVLHLMKTTRNLTDRITSHKAIANSNLCLGITLQDQIVLILIISSNVVISNRQDIGYCIVTVY